LWFLEEFIADTCVAISVGRSQKARAGAIPISVMHELTFAMSAEGCLAAVAFHGADGRFGSISEISPLRLRRRSIF